MAADKKNKSGKKRTKRGRKKKNGFVRFLKTLFSILLVLVILGGGGYLVGSWYFMDHFAYGTYINGTHVFRMTQPQVEEMLNREVDEYSLTVVERTADGSFTEETLTAADVGLKMVFDETLSKALQDQNGTGWILSVLDTRDVQVGRLVEFDDAMFAEAVDRMQCFDPDFAKAPQDAHIYNDEDKGPQLMKETAGNQADKNKVIALLSKALTEMSPALNLEDGDVYATPDITLEDKKLTEEFAVVRSIADLDIVYNFGDAKEVIKGETIGEWLTVNEDGTTTLDEDEVKDFVAELKKKYDTIFRTREFTTSYDGQTVTITDGDYGWWMNTAEEEKQLTEMILSGKGGERTPVYYQTANAYGGQDWGGTYVECNLTAQHLFLYVDGQMIFETDFVSGKNAKGRKTPPGIYAVTYKERFATLSGAGYSSPVSYWMPFNGNVGLHDATWRKKFGKNYYKNGGSHGCINLPCEAAKIIYEHIDKGTPVIVYTLKGTASESVTKQTAADIGKCVADAIAELPNIQGEKRPAVIRWLRKYYNSVSGGAKKAVSNIKELKAAESDLKKTNKAAAKQIAAEAATQAVQ